MDWKDYQIPVGKVANEVFVWMKTHLSGFFNAMADVIEAIINGFLWLLQGPDMKALKDTDLWFLPEIYPLFVIAVFVAIAWGLQRSWRICVGVAVGFLFILNQGYWDETTESLTLILSSCAVCMAVGVPIGIACAHNPRLNATLSPVLDLMQTLPTFVYLIPAIIFFGIGMVPGLIATVIFVLPAPIRLTELGVSSTPTPLIEAATAFGATPRQRLWKVELPWAMPQIMVGLNQTIMLSLSMVVISSLVGANGLGTPVLRALASVNAAKGFESGFVIVVLAIVLRSIFQREVK